MTNTETRGDLYVMTAEVPLANMFGYATELRGNTQGTVHSYIYIHIISYYIIFTNLYNRENSPWNTNLMTQYLLIR